MKKFVIILLCAILLSIPLSAESDPLKLTFGIDGTIYSLNTSSRSSEAAPYIGLYKSFGFLGIEAFIQQDFILPDWEPDWVYSKIDLNFETNFDDFVLVVPYISFQDIYIQDEKENTFIIDVGSTLSGAIYVFRFGVPMSFNEEFSFSVYWESGLEDKDFAIKLKMIINGEPAYKFEKIQLTMNYSFGDFSIYGVTSYAPKIVSYDQLFGVSYSF